MTTALSHRARGGVRQVLDGGVALALCRSESTALRNEEQGLSCSTDGAVTLVMDGRLDNGEALAALLLQHRAALRSRQDAALVLAAYEVFGDDFLRQVDGDFAIAIWDGRKRSVLLARDRFGVRPLFYHFDGQVLSLASEVKPILTLPWVPRIFNHCAALRMMIEDGDTVRETLWSGIERVEAGRWMRISAASRRVGRYWEPEALNAGSRTSVAHYIDGYRALLEDAVKCMSRSDHPVAIEASGGLDSSAIAAIACRHFKDGVLPAPSILIYT
jgi:asparagine synthase (glutamine-hydrolysing)